MQFLSRTVVVWLGLGLLLGGVTQRRSTAAEGETPTFRGTPVSTWIDRLKDEDVAVRRAAATALARRTDKAGPSHEVARVLLPVLFDTLNDADAGVRRQAALAWVRLNGDYRRPPETEAKAL